MDRDVTGGTAPGPPAGAQAQQVAAAGPTLGDPLAEALRIISLAKQRGLQVRLMGGLAFHARCREWTATIERSRRDIDFATRSKDRRPLGELLAAEGYTPDQRYNALHGHKQLYFVDEARERPVDVLVDRLEMCHTFEFVDRLTISEVTLPPAELLLSKLQVVKINRKDVLDALALLAEHPLAEGDEEGGAISLQRITSITSGDWGWWRTITGNLVKLRTIAESHLEPGELEFGREPRFRPVAQVEVLQVAIETAPKSTKWKLRSRVGDRMTWYEEPEEVGHSDSTGA